MTTLIVNRFEARTVPALLRLSVERAPNRTFVREIGTGALEAPPRTCSYSEFERSVANTTRFLLANGIGSGDRILLLAENSLEYQVLELATQVIRAVPCAVFANLGQSQVCDIALRVKPRAIFVSNRSQWEKFAAVAGQLIADGLSLCIAPSDLREQANGISFVTSDQVTNAPGDFRDYCDRVAELSGADPFLLLFTSGTTGRQKGVLLSQDAFVRSLEGGRTGTCMTESDDGLMFLPFAHVAGQCQFMLAIALGHRLILVSRREDLPRAFALGPTYSFAVPLVYEKLKERVEAQILSKPWPLRALLLRALKAACNPTPSDVLWLSIARQSIGKRLQQTLGGRLRMVASGGAAAPQSLAQFFESLGIPFISIYGMSETGGLISSQCFRGERTVGSAGLPSPDLELRIETTGELCVKGPLLMQHYLEPEDAVGSMDADGYFHTGDLAIIDPKTSELRVVGRCKNLLVLSTGKKLSPEAVELQIKSSGLVEEALLIGDGRPYVCAIVFVSPELAATSCNVPNAFPGWLLENLAPLLTRFSDYEQPKRLLVVPGLATANPNFVTPTLKLRRDALLGFYASYVQRLYELQNTAGILVQLPAETRGDTSNLG